jgi:hypothetical protein
VNWGLPNISEAHVVVLSSFTSVTLAMADARRITWEALGGERLPEAPAFLHTLRPIGFF